MRALTVRQPWAWAIVHGGKDVENRSRNIAGAYRGPVLIHAGLQVDEYASVYSDALDAAFAEYDDSWQLEEELSHLGQVVGIGDLADVHHADQGCLCGVWAELSVWHLCLANVRALEEPIAAKGRLGLWTPEQQLVDKVLAQLGEAA